MQRFLTRQNIGRGLAALSLLLAVVGAYGLTFIVNHAMRDLGVSLLVLAVPIFWASLALNPQPSQPLNTVISDEPPQRWFHWVSVAAGVGALLLFAELNGDVFRPVLNLRSVFSTHEHFQFALLCFGCVAFAWGLSGGLRWSSGGRVLNRWNDFTREQALEIAAVMALTLLAFTLRAVNLERAIPGFVDEVNFTAVLPSFENTDTVFLAQPINSVAAFPRLYVYFQWLSIQVFGQDLNGLRLTSALFGAFTAPALYWLCKHLFGRRDLALIAGLLLATLPIHLQLSRMGMNNPADPCFGVLGFALLARGVRYGGRANYVLGGVALGLAQYFHEAGRLAFPVLGVLWLMWMSARSIWQTQRVRILRHALAAAACIVIVGFPVYYTLSAVRYPFASRIEDVGLRSDYWQERTTVLEIVEGVRLRAAEALLRLFNKPELILYYAGDTPYIHYVLTPFIVLGFAYLLWRFWQPQRSLILMWLLLPFAGIVILLAEIMSARATIFLPALAVTAALGVYHGLGGSLSHAPQIRRWAMIGVVAGLCLMQTVYYFSVHLPRYTEQMMYLQPWQKYIFELRKLPRNTHVHLVATPPTDQTYLYQVALFITDDPAIAVETYSPDGITPTLLGSFSREINQAFMIEMPNPELLRLLRDTYPDLVGPIIDEQRDTSLIWYVLYIAPAAPLSG